MLQPEHQKVFAQCPLFSGIDPGDYEFLLSCINSYTKTYRAGEFILLPGDQVNHVGVVLSGSIEISKENPAGAKHILHFLGPSGMFGEGIVCTTHRISPVAVRVKEPSVILFIPYQRIIVSCGNSCGFHIRLIENMMTILGEKNMGLTEKIELLMLKGMREKLAAFLLSEFHKAGSTTFRILPNRNELAEYLNVSRPSMSRELARMKEEGLIDYYQNSFRILKVEELKKSLQ